MQSEASTISKDSRLISLATLIFDAQQIIEPYISATLESLLKQQSFHFELFFLDLRSSLNATIEKKILLIQRKIAPQVSIYFIKNSTWNAASILNQFLSESQGDLLGFLKPGGVLYPSSVEILVQQIEQNPKAVAAYAQYHVSNKTPDHHSPPPHPIELESFSSTDIFTKGLFHFGPTILIKKSIMKQINGWNPKYKLQYEIDFWMRLSLEGSLLLVNQFLSLQYSIPQIGSHPHISWEEAEESLFQINDFIFHHQTVLKNKSHFLTARSYAHLKSASCHLSSFRIFPAFAHWIHSLYLEPNLMIPKFALRMEKILSLKKPQNSKKASSINKTDSPSILVITSEFLITNHWEMTGQMLPSLSHWNSHLRLNLLDLKNKNYQIDILTCHPTPFKKSSSFQVNGINVHCSMRIFPRTDEFFIFLQTLFFTISALFYWNLKLNKKYDQILVATTNLSEVLFPSLFFRAKLERPLLAWLPQPWKPFKNHSTKWSQKLTQKFTHFFFSSIYYNDIDQHFLPLGVQDLFTDSHEVVPHSGLNFLFFGPFEKRFSIPLIIHTAFLLKDHPDWNFCIIGQGVQKDILQNFIQQMDLSHHVQLINSSSLSEIKNCLKTTDIVLCPQGRYDAQSFPDQISLFLPLYLSMKRPLIISSFGNISSFLERLNCGPIISTDDPAVLKKAILHLAEMDHANRLELGKNAYDAYLKYFQRSLVLEKIHERLTKR